MKMNLAYVHWAAGEALDRYEEEPVTRVVGGFSVKEGRSRGESGHTKKYTSDRQSLLRDLREAGVEPLAVLPVSWWRKLLSETDLVDAGSFTMMSLRGASRERVGDWAGFIAFAIAVVPVIALAAFVISLISPPAGADPTVFWPVIGLLCFLSSGVATVIVRVMAYRIIDPLSVRLATAVMFAKPLHRVLREDFVFHPEDRYDESVSFSFGQAPAEIEGTLLKLSKFPSGFLGVAAEAGAFMFDRDLQGLVRDRINGDVREERARRRAELTMADPIVYAVVGDACAVVCQYGDYQFEKDLVDRVVGQGL